MEDIDAVTYDLTGKKIIPLNSPIGWANATPPTTLPFQPVANGQSVAEGLCAGQGVPYYNEDGTVNVNAVATTLKMILDMYSTISQPVALLSMGAVPEWSQSVLDNNGGYPSYFIIRQIENTATVYYRSNTNHNMNLMPTRNSHTGWDIINSQLDFPLTVASAYNHDLALRFLDVGKVCIYGSVAISITNEGTLEDALFIIENYSIDTFRPNSINVSFGERMPKDNIFTLSGEIRILESEKSAIALTIRSNSTDYLKTYTVYVNFTGYIIGGG